MSKLEASVFVRGKWDYNSKYIVFNVYHVFEGAHCVLIEVHSVIVEFHHVVVGC
jgi:hypothetical protein